VPGLRNSIVHIISILRSSFSEVVVTGSIIMNKVFSVRVRPDDAIREAEVFSSTFRDTAVLMDDVGFLNSLGALGMVRVRGSLVVFVYDIHDVRPFCEIMGLPCLEPWDGESLVQSIREGRDYSEVFELPYVVRLGPWLSIDGAKGLEVVRRSPTFNKNWGEVMRWGLNRLIGGFSRELPNELLIRAQDSINVVGSGDGVLISGSTWSFIKDKIDKLAGYALVRSLYVNPLPKNLPNVKYVVDIDDFLSKKLGVGRLMMDDVAKWYNDLMSEVVHEFFFRGAGDPLMLIEWFIARHRRVGEVPIVILDPAYAYDISTEGLSPSYDMLPTYFEPARFGQVIDIVTSPLAALIALSRSGYEYGRIIAITSPCTLIANQDLLSEMQDIIKPNNSLLIIMSVDNGHESECGDFTELFTKYGIKYSAINYDPTNPTSALMDLIRVNESRGVVVINFSKKAVKRAYIVNDEYCDNCGDCLRIGCTAIRLVKKPVIEQDKCIGCGICELVCTRGAIGKMR